MNTETIGSELRAIRLAAGYSKLDSMVRAFAADPDAPFKSTTTLSRLETGTELATTQTVRWYVGQFPDHAARLRVHLVDSQYSFERFDQQMTIDLKPDGSATIRDVSYHDVADEHVMYYAISPEESVTRKLRGRVPGLYVLETLGEDESIEQHIAESIGDGLAFDYLDIEMDGSLSGEQVGTLEPVDDVNYEILVGEPARTPKRATIFEMVFPSDAPVRRVISDSVHEVQPQRARFWRSLATYRAASFRIEVKAADPGMLDQIHVMSFIPGATPIVDRSRAGSVIVRLMTEQGLGRGHGWVTLLK